MRLRGSATVLVLTLLVGTSTGLAREKSIAEEILDTLWANGQITEEQHATLVKKARSDPAETAAVGASQGPSWLETISFFGDFRGRYEEFRYDTNPDRSERDNRHRMRVRTRLGLKAKINDRIDFKFRLASDQPIGSPATDSRNQTLGEEVDFGPDGVFIDQTYIAYHPFEEDSIPLGGKKLDLQFGKMPNAFRSNIGRDYLIWDGDLTPEGVSVVYDVDPSERVGLTVNGGYFIIDEESGSADPYLIAGQVQSRIRASDNVQVGGNATYYYFRTLNSEFFTRATARGNLPGGLSNDSTVKLGDLRAWARCDAVEDWPFLLYGNVVKNFSAERTMGFGTTDSEDLGWGLGLEVGDKKKYVMLGAAYFELEANAVLGNFTDSDLFDGMTNREGWAIYGARQVFDHTDLKFTLLLGDVLDSGITVGRNDAERTRLQTDLVVKF